MSPVVAIVGAGGFIGGRLVETLSLTGPEVSRPVVRRASALAGAARFALDGRVADARDEAALTRAFAGCSHVVHAVAGDPATIVETVAPVYRAAAAAGVRRLVYLGSASVHGQSPAPGTDERSPLSDRQDLPYNNAKVRAERVLADLRRGGSVETVVLRPGIVHGPRSFWTGGFADEVLAGTAYLVGGGSGICNSAAVDNVVHAIRLALAAPGADGGAYIVGDAETVTWADLCRPVADALGVDVESLAIPAPIPGRPLGATLKDGLRTVLRALPRPVTAGLKAGLREWRRGRGGIHAGGLRGPEVTAERIALHTCAVRLPIDKARRDLGYEPAVSFAEACRRSVAWLAFAGYPIRGSRADHMPGSGS